MSEIKNNIIKKAKKINPALLDNYIKRLSETKKENFAKLMTMISKYDYRVVLTKLSALLEQNNSIDGFRNIHDAFVSYGEKAFTYLEKLYAKPNLKFEAMECIIFVMFTIGKKDDARKKLIELYSLKKNDEQFNLQIIVDFFDLDLYGEGITAAAEFMAKSEIHKMELVSALLEFFESHLEVESWIRKQNDINSKKLVTALDEYSEVMDNFNVSRDNIEFFKFEEFASNEETTDIEEIIFKYEVSNLVANYITSYKEEDDIYFLPYKHIKGFVYSIVENAVELIKTFADPSLPVLCNLDADASQLFAKDALKNQYEKIYSFFWEDMKLIYGDNIKPTNIDYFAWRMLCLTYSTLSDYLLKTGELVNAKGEDDENFINFIFGVSEEISGNIEEFVSCGNGEDGVFAFDEATIDYFTGLLKSNDKK